MLAALFGRQVIGFPTTWPSYVDDARGTGTEPNVGVHLVKRRMAGQRKHVWWPFMYTLRPVEAGEALLVSYGDGFWTSIDKRRDAFSSLVELACVKPPLSLQVSRIL
jgi:hypothetical protein